MKLLMSGDIELNPGPEQNVCDQTALSVGSTLSVKLSIRSAGIKDLLMTFCISHLQLVALK